MKEINSLEEFEVASNQERAIFYFTADWCIDCRFLAPLMDDVVTDNPNYKFYKVDTEKMLELAKDLKVRGIPSFLAYNNGEIVGRLVNRERKTKEDVQRFIDGLGDL